MPTCFCWVFAECTHDCPQLASGDAAVIVLVKAGSSSSRSSRQGGELVSRMPRRQQAAGETACTCGQACWVFVFR